MCAPVTKPTLACLGRSSISRSQPAVTSSITEIAGPLTNIAAFWSHALPIQSAPTVTGTAPPVTNPK